MQACPGICRGLTFGADHNKSGTNRIRIATNPVGTERQTGWLPMRGSKSQVQGSKEMFWSTWVPAIGCLNQNLQDFRIGRMNAGTPGFTGLREACRV